MKKLKKKKDTLTGKTGRRDKTFPSTSSNKGNTYKSGGKKKKKK